MDSPLPPEFLDGCSDDQRADADSWWDSLEPESQSEIYVLLDTRNENCAYVFAKDDEGQRNWHTLPILHDVLPDETEDDDESWITELLHYRLDHEDFVMASDMKVRTFHICSRHAAVREVLAKREVFCDFRCSISAPNCPMLPIASTMRHGILLAHNPKTHYSIWLCRD